MSIFRRTRVRPDQESDLRDMPSTIAGDVRSLVMDRLIFAEKSARWYRRKKKSLQIISKILRGLAIGFLTAGGITPIIGKSWIDLDPYFGYVLLALGGSCLLADRVFGVSAGWARFMVAATEIERCAEIYRIQIFGMAISSQQLDGAEIARLSSAFTEEIAKIVSAETTKWVSEFGDGQAELAKLVQANSSGSAHAKTSRHVG